MNRKIYALYNGDQILHTGTVAELAEQTGKTKHAICTLKAPSYLSRKTKGNRLELVELDDD